MTQEEKDLLFKDLSGRLLYGLCVNYVKEGMSFCRGFDSLLYHEALLSVEAPCFKPYLRPMSNMTEEERTEYFLLKHRDNDRDDNIILIDEASAIIDWLNAHHFDYRGLIEKGLALEAPENMYVL